MTSLSAFHPEAMQALQSDHAGAQRDAALERVRVAVAAAQRVAGEVHQTNGINIIDVTDYLAAAMGAVESEMED